MKNRFHLKISSTNVRLETTMQQKEETFQVIIDVIKNSTCFKALTIFADVLEIFMQRFSYTIKKVKDSYSYEFLLANKKCNVDADVFRKILDICPRVEGEELTKVQDDDATLTFLIDLGSKCPLHKYTNMYVDHMQQPWRTLTKSRGKGSQGKKTVDTSVEDVDVSKESKPEPIKKKAASRRVVKKKVIIFAADNIIPDPYVALELGKFISVTEAAKEEAARQVYATHVRIVTKSVPRPAKRRPSDLSQKLKGVQSLTPEEQEVADTMKALKEKKKTSKRQPGTRGSSEATSTIPRVLDESTVFSATSSKGTSTKPEIPDEEKVISEEKVILE
ncbi:hypothetical protein Tco_0497342 [Tanacetum coccineum]